MEANILRLGFPKIMGTFWGDLIIRNIEFWHTPICRRILSQ